MPSTPPPDPTTAAVALLSGVVGAEASNVLGTYAVIVICAGIGASWALSRRDPTSRMGAAAFFALIVSTTTMVTAGIAVLGDKWLHVGSQWLVAPTALIVAAIGHDWPAVAGWAINLAKKTAERKAEGA